MTQKLTYRRTHSFIPYNGAAARKHAEERLEQSDMYI